MRTGWRRRSWIAFGVLCLLAAREGRAEKSGPPRGSGHAERVAGHLALTEPLLALGDDVTWAISGSVALALQGVPVRPRDLDILTGAEHAGAVADAIGGEVVEPVADRERDGIRGRLGRRRVGDIEVEILGGVQNRFPDGGWTDPPDVAAERVYVDGVPVVSLGALRASYAARGRDDRVGLIDRSAARPSRDPP